MKGVVKQLSIFVNNEPGALSATTRIMKECNVNIRAFSISESIGFGVFRAIVDEPEKKAKELKDKGLVVKLTDVIAMEMGNEPGNLYKKADMVAKLGINIEYAYAYNSADKPILYIRVDDTERAIKMLAEEHVPLYDGN